jgi:hypothetical protein
VLRREVQEVKTGIVRMSPLLSDPYQSVERHYRITRQILDVLLETDIAPVVLTRAPRILDDLELLRRFRGAPVGFSAPTDGRRLPPHFRAQRRSHRRTTGGATRAACRGGRYFRGDPTRSADERRQPGRAVGPPYVRAVRLDRLYVGERVQYTYDENGLGSYSIEEYAAATIERLSRAFESRGVPVDPLDDFEPLLGP